MIARHLGMLPYNLFCQASVCLLEQENCELERKVSQQSKDHQIALIDSSYLSSYHHFYNGMTIDGLNPVAVEDRGGDDGAQGAGGVPEDAAVL